MMFTDDARSLAEAMAPAFDATPDEVAGQPGRVGGHDRRDDRDARASARALADDVPRHRPRSSRRVRTRCQAARRNLRSNGMAHDKKFRFGVQVSSVELGCRLAATRRARSRTSATRRSSCPITSSTPSSPRWSRSRSRRRRPSAYGSVTSSSATTTSIPRSTAKEAATHRPALGRPPRVRTRRRMDEDRLRRARHAVRPGRRAAWTGWPRRSPSSRARGATVRSTSRVSTTRSPSTTASQSRCSSRGRRSSSAAARRVCCAWRAGRPTSSASIRISARAPSPTTR